MNGLSSHEQHRVLHSTIVLRRRRSPAIRPSPPPDASSDPEKKDTSDLTVEKRPQVSVIVPLGTIREDLAEFLRKKKKIEDEKENQGSDDDEDDDDDDEEKKKKKKRKKKMKGSSGKGVSSRNLRNYKISWLRSYPYYAVLRELA